MHVQLLTNEIKIYTVLRERLQREYQDVDIETIRDTLEGITSLHELIAAVIRSALLDEALQQGLKVRMNDMKERMARLAQRGAKKRQLALEAMSEAELNKLEQPDFTASARSGVPGLVVLSEDEVPDDYWVPQQAKLDRQLLLTNLKRGASIAGAELGNPKPTLSVRTK
jgi:hypothetical protein